MAQKRSGLEWRSRSLVALGIVAGPAKAWADGLVVLGTDQTGAPARKTGGGFEFRRKLSSVDNPYCDIATYVLPNFRKQASSTRTADNHSVIVIDASTLKSDPAYAHFLMAHECCHHTLGHTRITQQRFGGVGVQPFYYLRRLLKNMERTRMLEFGDRQTGAYYPTGIERADNIAHAADEE